MTVIERYAAFAVRARAAGLDDTVQLAAVRAVIDWFAAASAGALEPQATALRAALVGGRESGRSVLFGSDVRTEAPTAALINGTASHAVEVDDIYREGLYHPGSPTVAAALAVAQRQGRSGADLLRAVAVGYEIGDRIAAAVNPSHYRFWHTTATVGAIGAAAAVAELQELDAERFAHALALAATMAAGLQQSFRSDSMAKPLHAGHAAQAGTIAGLAAAQGFTGALDVLEGEAGFGAAMSQAPDWDAATSSLGQPWLIKFPTVKVYSCCGHTFAAVDAALKIRAAGWEVDKIERIAIETYEAALRVAGNPAPRTAQEGRFSLQYCVAAALVLGSVRREAFEPDALGDRRIRRLVECASTSGAADIEKGFPQKRAARLTVTFEDGRTTTVERWTRKGDPDDPVTDDELSTKFSEMATPVYGASETKALQRLLQQLPDLPDVGMLTFAPSAAAARA